MFAFCKLLISGKRLTKCQQFSTVVKAVRKPTKAQQFKEQFKDQFPEKLLSKKVKTTYLYIADERAADIIDTALQPHLQQSTCDTIVEINPGVGHLTQKLLQRQQRFRQIVLMETLEHFMPKLQEYCDQYPDKVKLKQGDFVTLWKLSFQDKVDDGARMAQLLEHLPKKAYAEDANAMFVGAVGAYSFYKHLIYSLVFQQSIFNWGRCELYLLVPPPIYIHLTCHNDVGLMIYRSVSILFQILFEYRFIAQVPRAYLLPQQTDLNMDKKGSKLTRLKSINPECVYLVKIVPRRNLLELCAAEDLPALWYFVKQNCISRRNRIIPNLEKWMPGCGPRLIVNSLPIEHSTRLYPDELLEELPKYSKPCTTMTGRDYYPNMNIYTQFGDLTPSQMLSLFLQFRHWPEYAESTFLASLDSTLLKLEAATEQESSVDVNVIAEEDDVVAAEVEAKPKQHSTTKTKSKRTKKDKTEP